MQWTPPLLLLLIAVDAVQPFTCPHKNRWADEEFHGTTHWKGKKSEYTCHEDRPCVHWLIKHADHSANKTWYDYYAGCYTDYYMKNDPQGQLLLKYCGDSSSSNCTSTLYVEDKHKAHRPTYLCCCYTERCTTPDIYAFAKQQEALLLPTPPSGPPQKVTCEVSMRNATTPDGLLNATAVDKHDETCEAAWAPCVEFVYKNEADGLWRLWRAGCSYKYKGVNYKDIVELFFTTSGQCKHFDMLEPESRGKGTLATYNYTDAYACCCSGSKCEPPDAIDYYKRVALTTLPPSSNTTTTTTTTTASSTTTKQTTKQPTTTMTTSKAQPSTPQGSTTELSSAASATSTSEQSSSAPVRSSSTWTDDDDDYDDTTESPGGGGLPVWLLVAIAAAVVVGAVVAAAVVVARRRTREIHDDGLLPASLFPKYPWQPNKPRDAPEKSGAKSLLADTQMTTEAATAAASSASPSQPDETQHAPTTEATTQHSLSAEATTQQQGDDSKARSPESLSK